MPATATAAPATWTSNEICRLYADARISRIYAGTSEIMKEIIGRGLGLDDARGLTMSGPLTSLRVIEFSGIGPGPLVGQLLADLGADVVTVDRRSGEGRSGDVNRPQQRSVALNLRKAEGLAAVRCMLAGADVLIEGFRPAVMERLGLGPDACLRREPRLVYGRMTAGGRPDPWHTRPATTSTTSASRVH